MENMIEVTDLYKAYDGFVLNNISFVLPSGCIMGLVGENGAGKTTTIKAILNLIKPEHGKVSVFGKDMCTEGKTIRQDIGVVLCDHSFHEVLTIKNIGHIMDGIYKNWDQSYFERLVNRFNLPWDKKIKKFSTGMKMKLNIAAAMAHYPKLLILDEATSGLDPVVRDEVLDMLLEFIQDEERSVLISSHITSDLEKAADYITFIHDGEIFLSGEKDELLYNYGILHCSEETLADIPEKYIEGIQREKYGCNVLINQRHILMKASDTYVIDPAKLEDILIYKVRGGK